MILDRDELMAELTTATARFEALLRSLDSGDRTKPVHGLDWNVGETAAHVLVIARRGYTDMRRSPSSDGLSELNATTIAEIVERDPNAMADQFAHDMKIVLEKAFPRIPDELEFPFHANTMLTIRPAMSVVLGELLIHGADIAVATGKTWEILPRSAVLIWLGVMDIAYGWFKPEIVTSESYLIHFDGQSVSVLLRFDAGKVHVDDYSGQHADYTLTVDPVDFLFTFPYRRRESDNPDIARLCSYFLPL